MSLKLVEVAVPAAAPVVLAGVGWLTDYTLPFVGVPVTVVTMAAAGALLSFAYGAPEMSRRKLLVMALANTFIGTAAVTVLPAALNLEWISPVVLPPLAFLMALFSRWIIPLTVDVLPAFIRKWTGLGDKGAKT